MCDPVTLMIASTVATLGGQRVAAVRQEQALRRQQIDRDTELSQQAGAEIDTRQRAATSERARLRAMSAETGLTGISLTDIRNNVDFGLGMDVATMRQNAANALRANRNETSARMSGIEQPNFLAAALSTGLQIHQQRAATRPRG